MIQRQKNQWVDETGRPLTEEEVEKLYHRIDSELDQELTDTGFQGFLKKLFKKWLLPKTNQSAK